MGCGKSSVAQADPALAVPELRRRLSLGVDVEEKPADNDDDCALVVQLDNSQLLDLLSENTNGRKWSLGSETDKDLHRRPSFSAKTVKIQGDSVVDPNKEGIGFACKKGLKPEAPNQDSFAVVKVEESFSIYGVFDGHGSKGHDVSNFVKDQLPKLLVLQQDMATEPANALRAAFKQMQRLIEQATQLQKLNAEKSGCTASLILHDHFKNAMHVAHVGDSRCVLAKRSPGEAKLTSVDLTRDHKPNDPQERARIEANGGVVVFDGFYNHRVYAKDRSFNGKRYPGLNMSRALGDLLGYYDAGLSADPDVSTHEVATTKKQGESGSPRVPKAQLKQSQGEQPLPNSVADGQKPSENGQATVVASVEKEGYEHVEEQKFAEVVSEPDIKSFELDPDVDVFVLLCSDGVWEFISSQEAVEICAKYPCTKAMEAAESLSVAAWDAWQRTMGGNVVDDITAVLVNLSTEDA